MASEMRHFLGGPRWRPLCGVIGWPVTINPRGATCPRCLEERKALDVEEALTQERVGLDVGLEPGASMRAGAKLETKEGGVLRVVEGATNQGPRRVQMRVLAVWDD